MKACVNPVGTAYSICCGLGLMDRAFMDEGFEIHPMCEVDPEMRAMYQEVCGEQPIFHSIEDWSPKVWAGRGLPLIGGPPCQSHTRLKSIRRPKYPDLTPEVQRIVEELQPPWYLFENVAPVRIDGAKYIHLDAMHFGKPHQSRPRWFTYSPNITPPRPLYEGDVDSLMAYSIVAGRIYGPKRGAILQGWPAASTLPFPCHVLQKGLANAVHYGVARAWAKAIKESVAPPL